MKRHSLLLILSVLLLALLLLACQGGGDDNATPTPVPPAARSGMDALNATSAEGVKPECNKYPTWLECP